MKNKKQAATAKIIVFVQSLIIGIIALICFIVLGAFMLAGDMIEHPQLSEYNNATTEEVIADIMSA